MDGICWRLRRCLLSICQRRGFCKVPICPCESSALYAPAEPATPFSAAGLKGEGGGVRYPAAWSSVQAGPPQTFSC